MNDATQLIEENEKLHKRIGRPERFAGVLSVAAVMGVVVLLSGAAAAPTTLRAHGFELISDDGRVLAELVTRDWNPGLYLKDDNGTDRVAVFQDPETSGVYVMDADGVTRIGVAQFSHGGGGVALHGPASKGVAVLYFKKEGSLRFFDADGQVTNTVTATRERND